MPNSKSPKAPLLPEAQLVVRFDGETFKLEIPHGGGRRIVNLGQDSSAWGETISAELTSQLLWLKDQQQRKLELEQQHRDKAATAEKEFARALHKKVYNHSAATPGQGVHFANKIFGDPNKTRKVNPHYFVKLFGGESAP